MDFRDHIAAPPQGAVELDDGTAMLCMVLGRVQATLRHARSDEAALKMELARRLGDATLGLYAGRPLVTGPDIVVNPEIL